MLKKRGIPVEIKTVTAKEAEILINKNKKDKKKKSK